VIPEHPSDPPVQTAQTPTGPFSYTDEGEGPVVLAVHGLPGSVRDFRWLAPELHQIRFIRVDQPGFGGTPLSTEPGARLAPRGEFLSHVLDALDIREAVVLGHSFGGALATELAAREPVRVKGLALLASVGIRDHRGRRSFGPWKTLSMALRVGPLRRRLMGRLRAGYIKAGFPKSLEDDALVNTVHRVAWLSFARHKANLSALEVPTLVAWTEDDPLVEPAISEELYWHTSTGPRIAFADGGHNLQKTRAIELGQSLSAWVPTLVAGGV